MADIQKLRGEYDALARRCSQLSAGVSADELAAISRTHSANTEKGQEFVKAMAAKLEAFQRVEKAEAEQKKELKRQISDAQRRLAELQGVPAV
jgi:TolA-binding protein